MIKKEFGLPPNPCLSLLTSGSHICESGKGRGQEHGVVHLYFELKTAGQSGGGECNRCIAVTGR